MSKRIVMYLMAIAVIISIYYREYKRDKATVTTATVLHNVALRAINGTDPVRLDDVSSIKVVSNIYEGLYSYHPLQNQLTLIPNLAEGMPSLSPDGTVYTFKIKQGVFFQDDACFPGGKGRELQAADFIFSFKRIVDPNNTVPYVGLIEGKVKGLDGWKQQPVIDYAQEVEGLKALDPYTLQITLTMPWPTFLNVLAMHFTFVVAKEAVNHYGPEFVNHPVGTGPFILSDGFDPQSKKIEFIKNPTFRAKLFPSEAAPCYADMLSYAGQKLPLVDKVVTYILTEEQPRWLKMQKAEIDLDEVQDTAFILNFIKEGMPVSEIDQKGLVLQQLRGANTEFFAFNHSHALFSNLYLRKAISMAFDRETYNQRFYNNAAEVAQSLVPSLLMEDKEYKEHVDANPYAYNLEQAKAYLAKAGYPDWKGLPEIVLDTRSETTYKQKADFFAQCMGKVGIKVRVIANIWSEFCNKVEKKATMMHFFTWIADEPDPISFLEVIRIKNLVGLQYENTKFNTLFDQAATILGAARAEHFATLNNIVVEEVPIIWAVHKPVQLLHQKWVKNVLYNGYDRSLDQYIAVDMAEKARLTTS